MKLAEAFVEVRLKADKFLGAMRRTERSTERSARKIGGSFDAMSRRLQSTMLRLGAAIVAAFSFAAIIGGIRSVRDELDQLAKRARTIGITPQQLASFGFGVGQTTGLSSRQGQIALERFTKRTGEALTGQGEGASVLKALGLDTEEFARADPFGRLAQFSDALKDVTGRGKQLAFTQKLLGDEARLMLPYLELSRKQQQELNDQLKVLRPNLNEASLAAEHVGDAFSRFGQATRGTIDTVLVRLGPALELFADSLTDAALTSRAFGGVMNDMLTRMLPGLKILEGAIKFGYQEDLPPGSSGGGLSGGGMSRGMSRLGMNTQLGTFNAPGQAVISTLRRIAESNDVIAREVASKRMHGMALT